MTKSSSPSLSCEAMKRRRPDLGEWTRWTSLSVYFVFPKSLDFAKKYSCHLCGKFTYCVEMGVEGDWHHYYCGLCVLNLKKNMEMSEQREGIRVIDPSFYLELDKVIKRISKIGRERVTK
jgi:hypothetical protein